MIISASRRTDIPAFYSDWFIDRLEKGYLYVKNPMNRKQVSKIRLNIETIDCIVFWTKNPIPLMTRLETFNSFPYYFQYTLNAYDGKIEKNTPEISKRIDTFRRLSNRIGPEKIIWRYDPIFFTDGYAYEDHLIYFEKIARGLEEYTLKCVVSFLDVYKKCERNMKALSFSTLDDIKMVNIASEFAKIAEQSGISVETCAEDIDLLDVGVKKGKCIDDKLISRITGKSFIAKKDKTQRDECGCIESVDIGAYNSCRHNCVYCYANFNREAVLKNMSNHVQGSALMCGSLVGDEKIIERKAKTLFNKRTSGGEQLKF